MKLCENLQRLRRQAGMSQEALAEKLGVSRQAVSKWESGAAVPELEKLADLADIFSIRLDELLGLSASDAAADQARNAGQSAAAGYDQAAFQDQLRSIAAASNAQMAAHYRRLTAAVGVTAAALFLVFFLAVSVRLSRWQQDYQSELSRLHGIVSTLQSQLYTLQEPQDEPSGFFLSSDCVITQFSPTAQTATLRLSATPREFSNDPSSLPRFILRADGWSQSVDAVYDASAHTCTAQADVPLTSRLEISFVFTTEAGTERIEPVDTLRGLYRLSQFEIVPTYDGSYSRFNLENALSFRVTPRAEIFWYASEAFEGEPLKPVSGRAELSCNGEVLASTDLTFTVTVPGSGIEESGDTASAQAAPIGLDATQYLAQGELIERKCAYAPGDRLTVSMFITDNYGQEYEQALIDLVINEDGEPVTPEN